MEQRPLVSILIPTHNRPEYFKQALASARQQTYPNIEIVVSDDSDDDRTRHYVETEVSDPRVHYVYNAGFNGTENIFWLLHHFQGEYFTVLMDDDLIAPEKVATMVSCYEQYPSVALVTSHRQRIDAEGRELPEIASTERMAEKPTLYRGADIRRQLLWEGLNRVGETSTVLLKRKNLPMLLEIWRHGEANADIMIWLRFCEQGDVIYLPESLSYFRIHEGQDQQDPRIHFYALCEWCKIYLQELGRTTDLEAWEHYWMQFLGFQHNILMMWPAMMAQVSKEYEDYASRNERYALEGRYREILRMQEELLFSRPWESKSESEEMKS